MNSGTQLQKQYFCSLFFSYLGNLSLYVHGSEASVFSPNASLAVITGVCRCDRKHCIVHKGVNVDDFFYSPCTDTISKLTHNWIKPHLSIPMVKILLSLRVILQSFFKGEIVKPALRRSFPVRASRALRRPVPRPSGRAAATRLR